MKPHLNLLAALAMACLAAPAFGAGYSTGFDPAQYDPANGLAGQDGWIINDATPQVSFFVNLNRDRAGALGGFYDAPASTSVDLSHEYGGILNGAVFSVDLAMMPSNTLNPGRDSFGYTFTDASNTPVLRVAFEPISTASNKLEIVYYNSSNVRTSTGYDIYYGSIYHLAISFGANGADGLFSMVMGNALGSVQLALNAALPGAGSAVIARFGVDFDVTALTPAGAGNNYMIFDNVSIAGPSAPAAPTPSMAINGSHQPVISFTGIPGTSYQLQRSTSLVVGDWSTQATVTAPPGGAVSFVDLTPPADRAFYQVVIAPAGS